MQTIFEKIGGTYRQEGDYLLPNIEAPEDDADFPTEFKINSIKLYQNEGDLLVKR